MVWYPHWSVVHWFCEGGGEVSALEKLALAILEGRVWVLAEDAHTFSIRVDAPGQGEKLRNTSSEQAGAGDKEVTGSNPKPTVASTADLLLQLAYASDIASKRTLIEADREAAEARGFDRGLISIEQDVYEQGHNEGQLDALKWALMQINPMNEGPGHRAIQSKIDSLKKDMKVPE